MAHHRGQLLRSHCGLESIFTNTIPDEISRTVLAALSWLLDVIQLFKVKSKFHSRHSITISIKFSFKTLIYSKQIHTCSVKTGGGVAGGGSLLPIGQLCLGSIDIAVDTVSQYQPWHQMSSGCLVYIAVHLSTDTSINLNVTTAVRDSFHVHRYIICIYGCYSTSYKNKTEDYNVCP